MSKSVPRVSSVRTTGAFLNGRACSNALLHVINRAFDKPMKREELAAVGFAGGIAQHGHQCGMIWGAALAAGAEAHRRLGAGPSAEARAIEAARRIVESFREQNRYVNCLEITKIDKSSTALEMVKIFLLKGKALSCFRRAGRYGPVAFEEIRRALLEEHPEDDGAKLAGPVSCAAMVAQRMGATKMHVGMVAGFAGGIGLCGGACGALGAAVWLTEMRRLDGGEGGMDLKNPAVLELIDRFLVCSDGEFECAKIVGRRFESIADHAEHVREGGCAKIIEALSFGGTGAPGRRNEKLVEHDQ